MAQETETGVSEEHKKLLRPNSTSTKLHLPLWRKLMLVASMTGNEICVSFEQLYEVSLLQILGVPLAFVSLYPIVAGPLALGFLGLLGPLTDKGNHRKRKALTVVVVSTLIILGIAVLIAANLIYLYQENYAPATAWKNGTRCLEKQCNDTEDTRFDNSLSTEKHVPSQNIVHVADDPFGTDSNMSAVRNQPTIHNKTNRPLDNHEDLVGEDGAVPLPVTAIMALVGFGLMDIGYDVSHATTRSCILACSDRTDHISVLTLALAMAALGGCLNNGLGLIDLPGLFNLGVSDGSLVVQTTIQLVICALVQAVGMTCTVVTAFFNITVLDSQPYSPLSNEIADTEQAHSYGTYSNEERNATVEVKLETKHGNSEASLSESLLLMSDNAVEVKLETQLGNTEASPSESLLHMSDNGFKETIISDRRSSLSEEDTTSWSPFFSEAGTFNRDDNDIKSISIDYRSLSACWNDRCPEASPNKAETPNFTSWKYCQWNKHKLNFIIACITFYLSTSCVYSYNMLVTDFLGKEVTGGNFSAPPDSAEFKAYEAGVSMAASGLLVFFCCYLFMNSVHSRLLRYCGLRLDYCLSHVLMATALLCLTLSKQAAAFYVCCVVYSFQRSAMFTVPFIIANSCAAHEQEKLGKSSTAKMMAILTSMVPLNYCTAFVISGPLISLTHYNGASLLLAAACSIVAAPMFLVLYKP